ncbi:MAG: hypothetical protein IKH14_05895 [Prevotella sp.]|nr:hypothetical protein [Prevotella sp.]
MIYFTSTLLNIMVYLVSIAVVYYTLHKRFTDTLAEIETNYRLSLSRACTSFMDAMTAISKALDTDTEPEPTTLHEWAVAMCRSSGCHCFDGFECTRSDVVTDSDEQCPCDIERQTE